MAKKVHLTHQLGTYALTLCGRVVSDVSFTYDSYEATCKTCLKRLAEVGRNNPLLRSVTGDESL